MYITEVYLLTVSLSEQFSNIHFLQLALVSHTEETVQQRPLSCTTKDHTMLSKYLCGHKEKTKHNKDAS